MKWTTLPNEKPDKKGQSEFPGYPIYPPSEDVFNQGRDVPEADIKDAPEIDLPLQKDLPERKNSPDFTDDVAGGNQLGAVLDVPGSEVVDSLEKIGSEDEENNYYSLGGDNHDDLEEDRSV